MTPATKTEPISKFTNTSQPTNAPKAPASFQSPAPRLCRKTNGKSSSSPSPAPSREVFKPGHPPNSTFTDTPISNPGTVSQFGIRRLRQSVQPAISASATANPSTVGFKPPPTCTGRDASEPPCAKALAANAPPRTTRPRGKGISCFPARNAAKSPTDADFHIAGRRSQ